MKFPLLNLFQGLSAPLSYSQANVFPWPSVLKGRTSFMVPTQAAFALVGLAPQKAERCLRAPRLSPETLDQAPLLRDLSLDWY